MRIYLRRPFFPLLIIMVGIALLAYGVASGGGGIYFILFIPVIYGSGPIPVAGGLLLILGFFLLITSGLERYIPEAQSRSQGNDAALPHARRSNKRVGGLILIGPIPIIFGTDTKMAFLVAVVGLAILLLALFFFF